METIVKNNRLILTLVMLCAVIMVSCQEGDGEADYGFGYVYISQATSSGGLNNHCLVPDGAGKNTLNFKEENGKLNIYLGITRSGKLSDAAGFTVDVLSSTNMAQEAIISGDIDNAMLLPSSLYEIPDKVSIASGTNSATFYLSLDVNILKTSEYAGKKLVVALEIANPTSYQLSDKNTSVVVVIDVNAMLGILFPAS